MMSQKNFFFSLNKGLRLLTCKVVLVSCSGSQLCLPVRVAWEHLKDASAKSPHSDQLNQDLWA